MSVQNLTVSGFFAHALLLKQSHYPVLGTSPDRDNQRNILLISKCTAFTLRILIHFHECKYALEEFYSVITSLP